MAASKVVLLLLITCLFMLTQQMVSANIILECISILYCNGNAPVCGTNGTHCWHSKSDCERAKFNCFQLYKKDFDKVDLSYCSELTMGGIKECCVRKTCSIKTEQICAQLTTTNSSKKICRWFKNKCELHNHNCGSEKESFIETESAFCNFELSSNLQDCMESDKI